MKARVIPTYTVVKLTPVQLIINSSSMFLGLLTPI